ncbi:MAG: NADP oxidoreductase [Chloroflexota bacterium]|nr:MAG: NADP oxidoreductase [Chloroflexota bacterium]
MRERPSLGFVGAGKVGSTLARLWFRAGYRIAAVYSRDEAKASALAALTGAAAVVSVEAVIEAADLTLLTVPDDVIAPLAASIRTAALSGKSVIHTSGARNAETLLPLAERGAMIGSLHPAYPFADVETALAGLPGATFAVEAEPPLRAWLEELARVLDGRVLVIPAGGKAIYHSAMVIVSNYTVTLYAIAERLLTEIGAPREAADGALSVLLRGTTENLRVQGIPAALTGPLTRADVGTIRAHLWALHRLDPQVADLYRELARLSLPMLAARGVPTDSIRQVLEQEAQDASDDTRYSEDENRRGGDPHADGL